MKKSKFSSLHIAVILKEFNNGKSAKEITRHHNHNVNKTSLYKLRQSYAGMEASGLKRVKTP